MCCRSDLDCGGRGQECVGPAGDMVCKLRPPAGQCWDDADCGPGTTCTGAFVCGCTPLCIVADRLGTCG